MSAASSTIVPANRLGQLLAEARLRTGADLEDMSERSGRHFTVGELADLEAGHRVLDDDLVRLVTSLYEIGCGTIIPQRAELTIDLDRNVVSASGKAIPLKSTEHDHILDRYLSLVYVLRNREPGSEVPLRDEDVAILAASLAERAELIEEQLLSAMAGDDDSVRGLVGWFKRRLWVPGAGALVGAVSIGTLVMVGGDTGGSPLTSSQEPDDIPQTPDLDTVNRGVARLIGGPRTPVPPGETATTITSSSASSIVDPSSPSAKGAAAEALLPFDWEATLPGWTITYKSADPGFRGLTFPYDRTIELYVRDSDSAESLAGILAHELGHALDVSHLDDDRRQEWLDARDRSDSQWWPDAYASDFETGAGDFAESFAFWVIDDATSSRLAGTPDASQLEVMDALVAGFLVENSN